MVPITKEQNPDLPFDVVSWQQSSDEFPQVALAKKIVLALQKRNRQSLRHARLCLVCAGLRFLASSPKTKGLCLKSFLLALARLAA